MNGPHHCKTLSALEALIRELTDYKRSVHYNLSELLVVPVQDNGWIVFWQKDAR